jgi:hypothetical protein
VTVVTTSSTWASPARCRFSSCRKRARSHPSAANPSSSSATRSAKHTRFATLWLRGDEAFRNAANRYYDSLTRQIGSANNGDGYGVVATPAPEAKTGEGLGWSYFNFLHVASSAWTGLALLAREDPAANPYARLET